MLMLGAFVVIYGQQILLQHADVMLTTIGAEIAPEITDNRLISIFYGELSASGDNLINAKFL